jgi:hypothetical protein
VALDGFRDLSAALRAARAGEHPLTAVATAYTARSGQYGTDR